MDTIKTTSRSSRRFLVASLYILGFCISGCIPMVVQLPGDTDTQPTESVITVILANDTTLSLDPHLYVSAQKVSADELFLEVNLYADFDGSTLIDPETSVSVTFNSDEIGTIGSQQAAFASWSDWEAGKSLESPVIQISDESSQEPHYGQVIIFRFWQDDDGQYHTSWTVVDPEEIQ